MSNISGARLYAVPLILLILAGICGRYLVFSAPIDLTIRSSGTISLARAQQPLDSLKSEIRGMFLHMWWWQITDVDAVLDTVAQNGINMIVVESYPDVYLDSMGQITHWDILDQMTQGAHARGLRIHVLLTIGLNPDLSIAKDGGDRRVVLANGQTYNWLCPTKPDSRSLMLSIAQSLAQDYSIDGFMYDYIRYEGTGTAGLMCFCSHCQDKFIADTGLIDVVFPEDCLDGGRYYWDFIEWRTIPITELVRDMRNTMLTYNPNLEFSAAVFPSFSDQETWFIMDIGQHVSDWVSNGYLDFVAPMIYTSAITGYASITDVVTSSQKYFVGAREDWSDGSMGAPSPAPRKGAIRLPIFISQERASSVTNFQQQVDTIRALGADGFIVWRYEGPGLYVGNPSYDVRPYLQALSLPSVISISNVRFNASEDGTSTTVEWITNVPATSRVEYSQSPLFNGTIRYGDRYGRMIHWVDVDYVDAIVVEDFTLQTIHQIIIPAAPSVRTHFRIQSADGQGQISTSRVYLTV